MSELTTC